MITDKPKKRNNGYIYYIVVYVAWNNPYTQPPLGQPKILSSFCVLSIDDYHALLSESAVNQNSPIGYSTTIKFCTFKSNPIRWSMQAKSRLRLNKLNQRAKTKIPLFADQFIAQEIASKPSYFLGYTCYYEDLKESVHWDLFNHPTSFMENYE